MQSNSTYPHCSTVRVTTFLKVESLLSMRMKAICRLSTYIDLYMQECQPKIVIEIIHRTKVVLLIVQKIERPQKINPIQSQATAFGDLKFCPSDG